MRVERQKGCKAGRQKGRKVGRWKGWKVLNGAEKTFIQPNINFGAQDLKYCNSETQRKYLIDNYNWTFVGDTKDCSSVGLEDYSEYKIKIYPNPTTGNFTIVGIQNAEIKVYDLLGRKVLENRYKDNKIDISDQLAGIYFVMIQSDDKLATKKVLKN